MNKDFDTALMEVNEQIFNLKERLFRAFNKPSRNSNPRQADLYYFYLQDQIKMLKEYRDILKEKKNVG